MSLSVYLYFNGDCREAFDHYKSVFEAEEVCRQYFADGPADMFGDEPADCIMHTTIRIGETKLMGSDRVAACNEPIVPGNNFSVTYQRPSGFSRTGKAAPKKTDFAC
jgi:PhnB protein